MSETSRPVTLQQIANRGSLYYRLVWTEEGAACEQVFQTEEEAVIEMSAIEERLRAAAMAGQGFTVNPFGELKPFVNSRDVHYASLKLRPRGLSYWAVVTMSTVGFGDIVPQTVLGRVAASVLMLLGYAIIAVPTGIVTVELSAAARKSTNTQACPVCGADSHDNDARYCKRCGAKL